LKALLINQTSGGLKGWGLINRRWPPLDLLNCASLLEQNGIKAETLDLPIRPYPLRFINNKIKDSDIVFITSSSLDRWQCPNPEIEGFVSFVNSLEEKDKIYLMGVHATLYPEWLLNVTGVKGIVRGEPEFTSLEVCKGKTDSRIIGPIEVDLQRLPPPAYEKINLNDYYYELMGGRFALLETSRGCPFQCIFCFKLMYGNTVRKKDIENIRNDIDYVVRGCRARNVYFIDLEFALNKEDTMILLEHIIKMGLRFQWCCQMRVDGVNYQLLKLMYKAGCVLIHYGVESGSERILDMIKKGIDIEKIIKAIEMTKDAGIKVAIFFMFGFPSETEEEMDKTTAFAIKINPDYASFHTVIPYPKTRLSANKDISSHILLSNTHGFISEKVRRAYMRFYLRPAYILKAPFKISQLLRELKLFYSVIK